VHPITGASISSLLEGVDPDQDVIPILEA
jgi:hypothetical protein